MWWCVIMGQSVMWEDWFAVFKFKVILRAHIIEYYCYYHIYWTADLSATKFNWLVLWRVSRHFVSTVWVYGCFTPVCPNSMVASHHFVSTVWVYGCFTPVCPYSMVASRHFVLTVWVYGCFTSVCANYVWYFTSLFTSCTAASHQCVSTVKLFSVICTVAGRESLGGCTLPEDHQWRWHPWPWWPAAWRLWWQRTGQ